jgi:hypothetical protein
VPQVCTRWGHTTTAQRRDRDQPQRGGARQRDPARRAPAHRSRTAQHAPARPGQRALGRADRLINFSAGSDITLHAENGILGVGPFPYQDQVDPDLVNVGASRP